MADQYQSARPLGSTSFSTLIMDAEAAVFAVLTPGEAAKFLRVSPRTLERWRTAGNGPKFVKRNNIVRYRFQDLVEFINSGVRQNTAQ